MPDVRPVRLAVGPALLAVALTPACGRPPQAAATGAVAPPAVGSSPAASQPWTYPPPVAGRLAEADTGEHELVLTAIGVNPQ